MMAFRRKNQNNGQISILIIFSLIPLFTLFAFMVNIGMLVHAKISLQNAADQAAYSGAATQARQMTNISHLNYAMRESYKKFLFRFYVIGGLSLRCFPRGGAAPEAGCPNVRDDAEFDFINPQQTNCPAGNRPFPGVPAICIATSQNSNMCRLGCPLPTAKIVDCVPFDPICGVIQDIGQKIQSIQVVGCEASTLANQIVLASWLYATDMDADILKTPALAGLVSDVGLAVENIINYYRIKTVTDYINEPPKTLNRAQLTRVQAAPDQGKVERTVLAFNSAFLNLNEHVFDQDSITMTELMPNSDMLAIEPIRVSFRVPFVKLEPKGGNNTQCDNSLELLDASPLVGVYKKKESHVFYAIKLTAKARLLFNPFPFGSASAEGVELTAYSAAKPFGSRIGPEMDTQKAQAEYTRQGSLPDGTAVTYPYMRFSDTASMATVGVLSHFHQLLQGDAQGTAMTIDTPSYKRGVQASLIPTDREVGRYNIPADAEDPQNVGKGFLHYFGPPANGKAPEYTFWAPLISPDKSLEQLKDELKDELYRNVAPSATGGGGTGATGTARTGIVADFLNRIEHYLTVTLKQNGNFNVARIPDPIGKSFFDSISLTPDVPGQRHKPQEVATSYTTEHDQSYFNSGRDGYSVKYIPFKMLVSTPGHISNDDGAAGQTWRAVEMGVNKFDVQRVAH